jgi:hypothetical protein
MKFLGVVIVQILFVSSQVWALSFKTIIKNHRFNPALIKVPVGQDFELEVYNDDNTAEEFESHDLKKEKIVGPKKIIKMKVASLSKGDYVFFGEFNESTAQGKIVAE